MKPKHIALVVFSLCYFCMMSFANPLLQYEDKIRLSVLVLLGEWFGDTYFPLKEEINRRGWVMKRIGVDTKYRGCYNKARDVVLNSDILIPDFKDFSDYDCLIIPSGPQWRKFNQNPMVLKFLKDAHAAGLLIVSFCVGNKTVQAAGLFDPSPGEKLFPDTVKLVREGILLGPRGGGPPPGDGFKSAPIKEICDGIVSFHKNKKNSQTFSKLRGPYLGQKPPGMKPEIFAPGIVSTDCGEFNSVFSPNGNEFYFSQTNKEKKKDQIMVMRRVNNLWTKPEIAPFSGVYDDCDVSISTDGHRFFFISIGRKLPGGSTPTKRNYMWYMERTDTGWGEPQLLEYPGNVGGVYPILTNNRTLYFSSRLEVNFGKADIYLSRFINGSYAAPENLGSAINSKYSETDTYVAPDESFMIVTCWGRPENIGGGKSDLYISFCKSDGSWTTLLNMGKLINTEYIEFCPMLSPDGKYFFFSSDRTDVNECDIYWVDAKIIKILKPEDLD